MQAEARLASHYEAGKMASMAEVAHSPTCEIDGPVERSSEVLEYAAVEIAAALRLTRRASETELDQALSLTSRLRKVWDYLRQGLLDTRRVRVFHDQLGHLPDETVDTVTDRVLREAPELTTVQLRAGLSREVLKADPDGEAMSFRAGIEDRRVVIYANPDHTATIQASNLQPDRAARIMAKVNRLAQNQKTKDEERTLDQLRTDVFLDLLDGKHSSTKNKGGGTHLTVSLETLAELSDTPGELAGYGPVFADIARSVALEQTNTTWTYAVYDKDGDVIVTDVTRRRPSAATTRNVAA